MLHAILRPALVVLALFASSLLQPAAHGQEATVDPEAKKVLDAFGKYYAELKGFEVTAKIGLTVEQAGQKQSQDFVQKFAAEKPNKFSYALESAQGGAQIITDGKELSAYVKPLAKYAVEEAPPTLAALFQNPIVVGSVGFGNAGGVITAMVADDPSARLLEGVEKVEYGGIVELGDTKCHLLKATAPQFDWELWIDAGKEPLVRQFQPDLAKAFAKAAAQSKQKGQFDSMKVTNVASYTDWKVNPEFGPDAFAFKTPENAERVDSLMEMVTGRPSEPPPSELLGKPAPKVELDTLDGGKLDLAGLKGKVVILDFWATWCGPCRDAMPIIDKVAAEYKEKGVELFAVNIQEGAEDIKKFLEEAKLELPVALDTEGETAMAFRANAIPQTVLIGKDGTVQVVKVGLTANLAKELSAELDGLVEGKDLAAETLAKYEAKREARKKAAAAREKDAAKDDAGKDESKDKADDAKSDQ